MERINSYILLFFLITTLSCESNKKNIGATDEQPEMQKISHVSSIKDLSNQSKGLEPYNNLDRQIPEDLMSFFMKSPVLVGTLDDDVYYFDSYTETDSILFFTIFQFNEPCCIYYYGITMHRESEVIKDAVMLASIGSDGSAEEWFNEIARCQWLKTKGLDVIRIKEENQTLAKGQIKVQRDSIIVKYRFDNNGDIKETLVDSVRITQIRD